VATLDDDAGAGVSRSGCKECGASLAADQRYCLACGARRGPLPPEVLDWLSIVELSKSAEAPGAGVAVAAAGEIAEAAEEDEDGEPLTRYMPEPKTAAVAVMALLAFGVLLGAATGPIARSAGLTPIVLVEQPAPEAEPVEEEAEAEPVEEEAAVPAEASEAAAVPAELPPEEFETAPVAKKHGPKLEIPEPETLPPIEHVFLIVLGEEGYESTYGPSSANPYLGTTLRGKGELLANYFAVTQGALANEVALLSGQGPTPATAANCPEYKDVAPGTLSATGQAEGDGCVYPAETTSLPAQLVAAKKTWKAYIGGQGNGEPGQPASCRRPAPGAAEEAHTARPGDPYETWRNPFVYFHSIVDGPECAERDVGLDQLGADLGKEALTPSFSYIAPDACHDGGEVACEEGQPAGPADAQQFLETVVPQIEASQAYKKGGLIAIVSAQAPQAGPAPDASACCGTPEYPNLPPPATPPPAATGPVKETGGGGRVGMLLLSPFVEAGALNETFYNHYSFLASVEELLKVTPPPGYAAEPAVTAFDSTVFNLAS
jgi:hypothetical protein